MVRYLRGIVLEKFRNQVIVDVNGVGYDLFVTPKTLTGAAIGTEKAFHVSESIREDAHDLYGFNTNTDRDAFELLRKVSGVGPKVALAIIGFYPSEELTSMIHSGDVTKLGLVPGVGKKLASKIVLELKDKIDVSLDFEKEKSDPDTVEALQSLGYTSVEIAQVLPKVPQTLATSSERITWILRQLSQ